MHRPTNTHGFLNNDQQHGQKAAKTADDGSSPARAVILNGRSQPFTTEEKKTAIQWHHLHRNDTIDKPIQQLVSQNSEMIMQSRIRKHTITNDRTKAYFEVIVTEYFTG